MKRKKINSKGFTLVELLAVIAIMSFVLTMVIYTAVNVVSDAKEKSYQVTINNIEKYANNYILEGNGLTSWTPGITSDYEYQCVTVQNLIDKDYFDNDVLEAKVAENVNVKADDLIYLERDSNNKTIIKNILLVNDRNDYRELCGNIDILANIDFSVNPSGWSKNKDVNIYYSLYNNVDEISSYIYDYIFIGNEYSDNFNKQSMVENFSINKNGIISANIYDKYGNLVISNSYYVNKIDNIRPTVEINNYTGSSIVMNSVTIPLKYIDNESGVDISSVSLSDFEVYIGDIKVTDGISFESDIDNLIINNKGNLVGEIKILVANDKILDNAGNGNDEILLNTGINFITLKYTSYTANGNWYIWSQPGYIWKGTYNTSVIKYYDLETAAKIFNNSTSEYLDYQKKYAMGTWKAGSSVYIRTIADDIIYDDDVIQYKPYNANSNIVTFIRVWVKEEDINKGGIIGCLLDMYGNYHNMTNCENIESININGTDYWSVWVPWSCKGGTCPPNEVSIAEFATLKDMPSVE